MLAAIQTLYRQSLLPRAETTYSQCTAQIQVQVPKLNAKYIANLAVIYVPSSSYNIHEAENHVRACQSAFRPSLLFYADECKMLISPFLLTKMPLKKRKDKQNKISYVTKFHTNRHSGKEVMVYAI